MIHLVENDLCCPSGEFLPLLIPVAIQIFHLDVLISGRLTNALQRKAAFLSLVWRILLQQDRIVHHQVHETDVHNNDPLAYADHVGCHADTPVLIGPQSVLQILTNGEIHLCGFIRFLPQEKYISDDWLDHFFLLYLPDNLLIPFERQCHLRFRFSNAPTTETSFSHTLSPLTLLRL